MEWIIEVKHKSYPDWIRIKGTGDDPQNPSEITIEFHGLSAERFLERLEHFFEEFGCPSHIAGIETDKSMYCIQYMVHQVNRELGDEFTVSDNLPEIKIRSSEVD